MSAAPTLPVVSFGPSPVSLEEVAEIASGRARVALDAGLDYRRHLEASRASLERQLRAGRAIYGVTTGVGESCETEVAMDLATSMAVNLLRLHGCGTGALLSDEESSAVMAVRLASLARGYSGVRPVVLERLVDLLNHRILPRIPSEGSVGASGDLTPLSYVAAVLIGEGEVSFRGQAMPAAAALAAAELAPLTLLPQWEHGIVPVCGSYRARPCEHFGKTIGGPPGVASLVYGCTCFSIVVNTKWPLEFPTEAAFALKAYRSGRYRT